MRLYTLTAAPCGTWSLADPTGQSVPLAPDAAAQVVAGDPSGVLVVPDATEFAKTLQDPRGVARCCDLARADRLVCFASTVESMPAAATPPAASTAPGVLRQAARAALGRQGGQFGPGGLWARVRSRVACGLASNAEFVIVDAERRMVVDRCEGITRERGEKLSEGPDAAGLLTQPSSVGPVKVSDSRRLEAWVRGQWLRARDRYDRRISDQPAAPARLADWPPWMVCTSPFARMADLTAAGRLAEQLRSSGGRLRPRHWLSPGLRSDWPNLTAYLRLQRSGGLPACMGLGGDRTLVRVRLPDVSLLVVALRPAPS